MSIVPFCRGDELYFDNYTDLFVEGRGTIQLFSPLLCLWFIMYDVTSKISICSCKLVHSPWTKWNKNKYNFKICIYFTVGAELKIQGYKLDCGKPKVCGVPLPLTKAAPLNGDITDFLVKNEYMFVTKDNPVSHNNNYHTRNWYLK